VLVLGSFAQAPLSEDGAMTEMGWSRLRRSAAVRAAVPADQHREGCRAWIQRAGQTARSRVPAERL